MITCPWCDDDATGLLENEDAYQCLTCGTCVDLPEEPAVLDRAA